MNAYTLTVAHEHGMVVRTVEFDGERITRAVNLSGEEVELAAEFRTFAEALLVAHEGSDHAGEPVRVTVEPK